MHALLAKHRAFTFIEMIIVVFILAILSVSLSVAYQKVRLKVRFDANVSTITNLFQKARSLSLATVLVGGTEPVEYYALTITEEEMMLIAQGSTLDDTLGSFTYDADMSITSGDLSIYYFPPYGEVCIGLSTCDSGATEAVLTFDDDSGTYSTEFTLTAVGGFVEVEQVLP